MYQISEFSKLSNTSIQTLRYYDSLDLLKPKVIGKYNSYRYYTKDHLIKLNIIKKIKNYGF
jgi:DNA-binding transcriptional MerR regulator